MSETKDAPDGVAIEVMEWPKAHMALKRGMMVTRTVWRGERYLKYVTQGRIDTAMEKINPFIVVRTAGGIDPYIPSNEDLNANDWVVY